MFCEFDNCHTIVASTKIVARLS